MNSERNDMDRIYLDYACTSYPKPDEVVRAVTDYMTRIGSNVSRSSYGTAYEAEEIVYDTRAMLCDLFHGPDVRNVIFTRNITESLNVLLKGLLKPGDHVLVSAMEHNAVMRPLNQIARELPTEAQQASGGGSESEPEGLSENAQSSREKAITYTRIPCDTEGFLQTQEMEKLLRPETRAVVMMTASNVSGTLMPVDEVGAFCRKHGLIFIVDSAQTAGAFDIDMKKSGISALAFTGHKGLLGPQGTGGFIITDELAGQMDPLISGGTGSFSHTEQIPEILPDRFEAGTLNLPGIAGLGAALKFLRERGTGSILAHERHLTQLFLDQIASLEESGCLKIAGPRTAAERSAVVSICPQHMDPSQLAFRLEQEYGIMTRVGLHCAPSAHKSLGTFPSGTVRFSFGWATTQEEIQAAARGLDAICRK